MPGMRLPLVWVRSNNVMTQRYERHMLHLIMTACVIPWRRDREDVSIMTIYIPFLTTSQLLCLGAAVQCYGTIGDIFSNERGDGTFLIRLSQRWTWWTTASQRHFSCCLYRPFVVDANCSPLFLVMTGTISLFLICLFYKVAHVNLIASYTSAMIFSGRISTVNSVVFVSMWQEILNSLYSSLSCRSGALISWLIHVFLSTSF